MPSSPGHTEVGRISGARCRAPQASDGATLLDIVRRAGTLEPNTAYAYVMMADQFADTCVLAEVDGEPAGCIVGFRSPRSPRSLFVWQIGVLPRARRRGLAHAMLDHVLSRAPNHDIDSILTTVDPENESSEKMFRGFATARHATMENVGVYEAGWFPGDHQPERMFRIAGLRPAQPQRPHRCEGESAR